MARTSNISARVEPEIKEQAQKIGPARYPEG